MRKNILFTSKLLLLWALVLTGCRDSVLIDSNNIDKDANNDGWQPVKLAFETSEQSVPKVRTALTPEDENAIKQVRVLVFDNAGQFDYEAKVMKISPSTEPGDKKGKGTITLLAQNSQPGNISTFVLLANVEGSTFTPAKGTAMEEVMKLFTFDMPTDGEWTNRMLPMWGKSQPIVINHSSGVVSSTSTIYLSRAVARVDVGLNVTATANGASPLNEVAQGINYTTPDGTVVEVKLTKLYLYNTNNKGRVAPIADDADIWNAANRKAKAPSLPQTAPMTLPKIDRSEQIVDGKLLLRDIFLPEAVNTPTTATAGANGTTLPDDPTNYLKRPFMVVGLVGADRSNPNRETFFRIDYLKRTKAEPTATYEFLPLLRNYRYLVNITRVEGHGFNTEEEAMKGPAANIMYNVEAWEESSMSNVQYDGQYMLGISNDDLTYYNRKSSKSITIRTSWPKGWEAAVTSPDSDWLTIDKTSGGSGADESLAISVADNLDANAGVREGIITITAGRMSWKVKVKQLTESELSVKVYDKDGVTPITMLVFSGQEETKQIVVEYSPSDGNFVEEQNLSDFTLKPVSSSDGRVRYNITSKPMLDNENEFETKSDVVQFTVSDNGAQAGQALILLQTEYNVIPYEVLDDQRQFKITEDHIPLYLLDGVKKNFIIKANTRYELKMVSNRAEGRGGNNPDDLELIESGFVLDKKVEKKGVFDGEKISFTPYDDFTDYKRSYGFAEFEISSPDNLFPSKRFKIMLASGKKQPSANCYMVKPNEIGILIPISRINEAKAFYDENSDQFSNWEEQYALHGLDPNEAWMPKLLWSDMESVGTKPVNSDGTAGLRFVKRVRESSEAQAKYIYVLPGKKPDKIGNALIACQRVSDDKIIWSWHIWVVNEYPKIINLWLDRNIGANVVAKSSTDGNKASFGMQYHFGRKDPIPLFANRGSAGKSDALGVLVNDKGELFKLYNPGPINRVRLSMRESIEQPTRVVYDGRNWMTGSDNDKRLWYNLWGGEINDDESDDAWSLKLKTNKTVFDPCPYGWKVPALGEESDYRSFINSGVIVLPRTGRHYDGNLDRYDRWNTYYGLSTVYRSKGYDGARSIYYSTEGSAPSLKNHYSRTMGRVIRCVKNSGYQQGGEVGTDEYKDYTNYLP